MSVSSGNINPDVSMTADSAITRYRILTGDTGATTNSDARVNHAATDADVCIGVSLDDAAAAGDQVPVRVSGVALVEVDGSGTAIDINTLIVATTAGEGIAASAADGTAAHTLGIALAPSAADGDIIPVLIDRVQLQNA